MKMYKIWFEDITQTGEWLPIGILDKELPPPAMCTAVGYLARETKKYVYLSLLEALHPQAPDMFGGMLCIPKGCITKRKELK